MFVDDFPRELNFHLQRISQLAMFEDPITSPLFPIKVREISMVKMVKHGFSPGFSHGETSVSHLPHQHARFLPPGEYGADAFNAKISGEDQDAQAKATKELTETGRWSSCFQRRSLNNFYGISLHSLPSMPKGFEVDSTSVQESSWLFLTNDLGGCLH